MREKYGGGELRRPPIARAAEPVGFSQFLRFSRMCIFSRIRRSGPKRNGRGRGFGPLILIQASGTQSGPPTSNDQSPRPLRHTPRPALPPREAWSRDCRIPSPLTPRPTLPRAGRSGFQPDAVAFPTPLTPRPSPLPPREAWSRDCGIAFPTPLPLLPRRHAAAVGAVQRAGPDHLAAWVLLVRVRQAEYERQPLAVRGEHRVAD